MPNKNKRPGKVSHLASSGQTLRRQAERIALESAARSLESLKAMSPETTRQMLHELHIHQIELEMQNEELQRTQVELDAAKSRYFDLFELAPVGYFTLSEQGLILEANLNAASLLGVARGALVNQPIFRFIFKEDQDIFYLRRKLSHETGEPQTCELRLAKNDGSQFWAHLTATAAWEADGVPVLRVVLSDITERKQAEEKLQLAASVFSHAHEGIMITDSDGTIIDVNDAFCDITGYNCDEIRGQNPRLLSSDLHDKSFYAAMWRDLVRQGRWSGEAWNRRKNGEEYAVMQTISAVRDAQGKVLHYVSLFSDITLIKEHEHKLELGAHYDALTGLPNRVLLADRLLQGMAQARRRGQLLAVAFLDLDGFKTINDEYGHTIGDQLLIVVAARMKQALREGDTLARMGGDEFVAELLDLADIEAGVPMLTRLLAAAAEPLFIGNLMLQITASLGVTFYPQPEEIDADQLLRQADQAMYQAKLAGRNRYHLFDAEQDRSVRGRYESLEHIRHALTAREFVLYYQPKVNMRTGRIIGAEALIRWQHPEKGLLPPDRFLPTIEDHSLAIDVGEWVIDAALTQMEIWQAAGLNIPVSVNVGAHQLQQTDFAEKIHTLLAAHPNVSPDDLELEILETSALNNLKGVSQMIATCQEIGVMFAMDDFGTGYSSLTYFKLLPVTTIKIDQTFVRDMLNNLDDLSILRAVLSLSAAFQREVIAEGVETIEHGAMLLQLGCNLAQGYGIARPMSAADLPGWAATWRPDSSWINVG